MIFSCLKISFSHAERGGFEPPIRFWRIHAFQACLFNHSSISPKTYLLFFQLQMYPFFSSSKALHLFYMR